MATAEDVDMKRPEQQGEREEQRRLAVDEAFENLDEYYINRGRVVFMDNNQTRRGGFGVVRQAHLKTSAYLPTWIASRVHNKPQLVAVKQIAVPVTQDARDLKRAFTKEVLVWSRVKGHPGISRFIGFHANFNRREAWLISPWEQHGNVSEFIKGRELEVPEKLSLAYDALDALAFLHQLDPPVCHCGDIKAANVLVNMEYRAVLWDFGLARLHEDIGFDRLESTAAMHKGSIRWCSPELFENQPRTSSSDIYAWGWLVWEITTGEVPYEDATTDYTILRRIVEGPVGNVNGESRLKDFLQLWDLMTRCWAVDPRQRPTAAMCKTTFEYLPHCPPVPKTADPHASAALLENLGDLESWKGNHKAGLIYLDQALDLYQKEGNDTGIVNVLRKQAAVAHRDSNWHKRRDAASAALEKCRDLQDDIGTADALLWMAYEKHGEDAIRDLQESLKIFRARGDSVGVVKCLRGIGEEYRRLGQPKKALSDLEEAVDVASRCGDRLGEARALQILGLTYSGLNQMDEMMSALQRARDIARDIGWEPGLSSFLCSLGKAKFKQGSHGEAEELVRESVRLARNSDAGWRLAQALKLLGKCLHAQGRLEEAISVLGESCSNYQALRIHYTRYAGAANLLADSKSTLGHKEEALAWYDTAIAEWHKGGNRYKDRIAKSLAAKDVILADMKQRDEGALHGEASP